MNTKKHEHSGCTGRSLENPKGTLGIAGLKEGNYTLLDIGAGSGYLSLAAAEILGKDGKVFALESHEASVRKFEKELSEKGVKNISALKADAVDKIPLQRDSVDFCLMANVLHGFAANGETDKVLKNVNSVLKEDGALIIIDFKKAETQFGPPLTIRLSPEQVEGIVTPYGYALTNSYDAGPAHYGLVFKKICLQDKFC